MGKEKTLFSAGPKPGQCFSILKEWVPIFEKDIIIELNEVEDGRENSVLVGV